MKENKIPSAEEYLKNSETYEEEYSNISLHDAEQRMIEFAKIHVKAALDAAFLNSEMRISENDTTEFPNFTDNYDDGYVTITISKNSILSAYPEELIK